jgi:YMGG-like Gly-zipper
MARHLGRLACMVCATLVASACVIQPNAGALPASGPPMSPAASLAQAEGGSPSQISQPQASQPANPVGPVAQYYPPPENQYGSGEAPYYPPERPAYGQYGEPAYPPYGGNPYRRENSGPFIYPAHGQTPQQEQIDKGQCYTWAVQQSGFDPANPPRPTSPPPEAGLPQGGLFRGAAGGAALGAIGGAIGGNAGKGAAMGAAMGGLFGGMRRREWMAQAQYQQQAYQQRQQNVIRQGRHAYNRAFRACMVGRGYTLE